MRRILYVCSFLALTSCSAEHERQQSTREALDQSKDCQALPTHGMRARCIGVRMLQSDQRNGINPKYDVQKIDAMTQIEDAVDQGKISEQDANQRLALSFAAVDARAKSDDRDRDRESNVAAGIIFQNGMMNAAKSFNAPYNRQQNCTTMPLGAGQYTTHCY